MSGNQNNCQSYIDIYPCLFMTMTGGMKFCLRQDKKVADVEFILIVKLKCLIYDRQKNQSYLTIFGHSRSFQTSDLNYIE